MSASPLAKGGRGRAPHERVFTPLPWSDFFDERRSLAVNKTDTFSVYVKGGDEHAFKVVCLHGAGYSGLTWACFAEELARDVPSCQLIAPDLRCHGETRTADDYRLDEGTQVDDLVALLDALFGSQSFAKVLIVGHSMGGALATRLIDRLASLSKSYVACGLVVVDVVEGSALDALNLMSHVIAQRPSSFDSLPAAIKWCQLSGTAKNNRSARVSMPAQLVECATTAIVDDGANAELREVDEEGDEATPTSRRANASSFKWRIDLLKTEAHWRGWFVGLSDMFLGVSVPKLLLIAGSDRLDTALTIGQMQGKFQMVLLAKTGHAIQEDSPNAVADTIRQFAERHRLILECESSHLTH